MYNQHQTCNNPQQESPSPSHFPFGRVCESLVSLCPEEVDVAVLESCPTEWHQRPFFAEMLFSRRMNLSVVFGLLVVLCFVDGVVVGVNGSTVCETEEDVDHKSCRLEDLKIPALIAICNRVGFNVDKDIFSYLLEDRGSMDPDQEDFVEAAHECLRLEVEGGDDPVNREIPYDEMEKIVKGIIQNNPELIDELVEHLKKNKPDLWEATMQTLKPGEKLHDRADVVYGLMNVLKDEEDEVRDEL